MERIVVIGGGLAGSEASYRIAEEGVKVLLYEMRPKVNTPAHKTEFLAELVCSNTFGSIETTTGAGLLKAEMKLLDSLVLKVAEESAVPAGVRTPYFGCPFRKYKKTHRLRLPVLF